MIGENPETPGNQKKIKPRECPGFGRSGFLFSLAPGLIRKDDCVCKPETKIGIASFIKGARFL